MTRVWRGLRWVLALPAGVIDLLIGAPVLTGFLFPETRDPYPDPDQDLNNPYTRKGRLRALLFKPSMETEIDEGRGTIVLDRKGKAFAVGWGWDPAHDVRVDGISEVAISPTKPYTLIVHLPAPRLPLTLEFQNEWVMRKWLKEFQAMPRRNAV